MKHGLIKYSENCTLEEMKMLHDELQEAIDDPFTENGLLMSKVKKLDDGRFISAKIYWLTDEEYEEVKAVLNQEEK